MRLVTGIEIPFNQQKSVYTGSMLKQLAVLKHFNETFSHGVAPVSWDWNCSHPTILRPNFPSDQEYQPHLHSKTIRNGLDNSVQVFTTAFNSSSIHANALKAGEALINVKMAIEYPQKYSNEQNWFTAKTLIKV